MRTQAQGVLVLALAADPHLQKVQREHVALEQKLVVLLQRVERERRGAFAPLLGQPAILSLLIPSGGIGIVKALEPLVNLL